jgi:uncharacterized protein (TIGR00255 family)
MLSSMTGYGRGEASRNGITATVELRSVNNRFLEVSARLPRTLAARENEVKELIRRRINRGKINATVTLERKNGNAVPLLINAQAAKEVHKLLNQLRKIAGLKEKVKLEHLLQFSEVIQQEEPDDADAAAWDVAQVAIADAVDALGEMRLQEGRELEKDFQHRIALVEQDIVQIEEMSKAQVPAERERLRERIKQLLDQETIDEGRLEMELAVLADRIDVTEECVRFRSHTKFFLKAFEDAASAGRKLNFLLQELNREANTIGSKSVTPEIAHVVVHVKEELEKIREQVQNIE